MAYPTWLVFFKNETKFVDFFFEIYVPFDCKFMVAQSSPNVIGREIITEVYQVDRGKQLRSMRFGIWDARSGLNGPTRGLFLRRNNLYGQNIRVTSVHDPPISLFHRNERNEITGMSGFFGEVILLLQQALNCTSFNCLAVSLRKYSSSLAAALSSKISLFRPVPVLRRLSEYVLALYDG